MDVDSWIACFGGPVKPDVIKSPEARSLVSFITRYAEHIASLVEIRASNDWELVVLDFQTGRPQQSTYPIRRNERIGICFSVNGGMPIVYMLRDDFPDTEHQLLTAENFPRAICIDDRIWQEARLTWTPAELVNRVLSWFSRAARGELHDVRQPIDPVLFGSVLSFLLPRTILNNTSEHDLVGIYDQNHRQTLRVKRLQQVTEPPEEIGQLCIIAYRVPPEQMKRMRFAPSNLGSLADILAERGINLFADLSERLGAWIEQGQLAAWRLQSRLAVIVEMPIVSPNEKQQNGRDIRAYVTDRLGGDIAVALGIGIKSGSRDEGSKVGFVKAIAPVDVDTAEMRDIQVQIAEVHYEFDRALATQLTGRSTEDSRKAVLVGAGAIGSYVSDCVIREGRFSWTVIDDDYLLPHNLARHTGRFDDVTKNKAQVVSRALSNTFGLDSPADAIGKNLFEAYQHEDIAKAFSDADLIIDATASVLAERFLSDHPVGARRVSMFFNPTGKDAVLFVEPTDRTIKLRDLEAQYLGLLGTDERLASHLSQGGETFAYTGACRVITNLIPASRIMTLSGLVAGELGRAVDVPNGALRIWRIRDDGGVDALFFTPETATRMQAGDWTVTIDAGLTRRIKEMRTARFPNETGGILFGVVDIPEKSIHIVSAGAAPPDSKETPTGFTRGTDGVQEHINRFFECTQGQVRYVGEWHSHPPRAAALPSATDFAQIDWLATLFDMDTLPALMLIVGEEEMSIMLANTRATPLQEPVDQSRNAQ